MVVGFPTGMVVTGVSTFNNAVSIAGTLTYDDVTNIDSVGIITARSGINVSAGGINAIGVVTATSFVGSGAILTDVISGVELKFGGNSVGTAVTSINFVGFSSIQHHPLDYQLSLHHLWQSHLPSLILLADK